MSLSSLIWWLHVPHHVPPPGTLRARGAWSKPNCRMSLNCRVSQYFDHDILETRGSQYTRICDKWITKRMKMYLKPYEYIWYMNILATPSNNNDLTITRFMLSQGKETSAQQCQWLWPTFSTYVRLQLCQLIWLSMWTPVQFFFVSVITYVAFCQCAHKLTAYR